jgi:hypothetical protein
MKKKNEHKTDNDQNSNCNEVVIPKNDNNRMS